MVVGHSQSSWLLVVVAIGCCGCRSLVVVSQCQSWLSWLVIPVTVVITLPVVSTAPSMAEGTAGIEPTGGAEKVPTA